MKQRRANGQFTYDFNRKLLPVKLFILSGAFTFGVTIPFNSFNLLPVEAKAVETGRSEARMATQSSLIVAEPSPVPPVLATPTPVPTIKSMIQDAFGEDWKIAYAISMAESGRTPTKTLIAYAGHYSWSSPTYKGECSVGLFMINLASDGCNGTRIHWNKMPGQTLEAKIEWLKVPENNIRIAKEIYDRQGFSPWSTYTNGKYLKFLEE